MDQYKIGKFIALCRKEHNLTQRQLADKLDVSDKTISKWECGNGLPEISLMLPLCEVLEISVNELLSGEKIEASEYRKKAELNFMDLIRERQENKKKTILSVIIGLMIIISATTMIMAAGLIEMSIGWRIALIVVAAVEITAGITVACVLDRSAGYYECPKCKTRFMPSMSAYVKGMHGLTWRRLKCPNCGKVSNCKKKLTKNI